MEIIIWGDNMKRQISVSIFLSVLVIILALMYIKFNNETRVKEEQVTTENEVTNEESITISQEYISYPYYIKSEYGRLVVYESKYEEVFMETGIEVKLLPFEIQEKLKSGIFFQTEGELYDFLEAYSS